MSVEIIAEIGNAHDGSLGLAHAHIDAACRAGADTVKFQTHIAEAESTPSEPWRVKFSTQDDSRYDYWKRIAFTEKQWAELKRHAEDKNMRFLSSPFSVAAFELLQRIGVDRWKIASGEVNNKLLLERIEDAHQPVLLSTGLCIEEELDAAVELFGCDLTLLHCVPEYPTPPSHVGLNNLARLRKKYEDEVYEYGLSDHTGTIYPSLLAAYEGAKVLEVHLTLSRDMWGPDVSSSLTPAELKQLVDGVRFIDRMEPCEKKIYLDLRRIFMTRDEHGRKTG